MWRVGHTAAFLDFATVSHDDVDVAALHQVLPDLHFYSTTTDDEVSERIVDSEILLINKVVLDKSRIDAAPRLRLICAAATGTDNVDLDAARARDIAVCNIRSYCTSSVAQHVFALVLALTHHLEGYQRLLSEGAWRGSPQFCLLDFPIRELSGKVLGIVGHGELGGAVATIARAFGMHVLLAERPEADTRKDRLALQDLLHRVDILSLHCPLNRQTHNLIAAAELARMKPDALLINTARGALVDATALVAALRAGKLGGAGIDVLEREPPVAGSPLLEADIPHLIVTPHIAWAAVEARQRAIVEIAANITAWQAGERRNRVV
ncbi:MAG: 2-hydroxyacid dehydrogenase [Gammaproteobacteria bacterium]|nr:2-hydroxyacid dehydrogenase [Gammaproteobacteria bacterium]MDH3767274.1 2-hydroxyacid dehydrogenase [Gammaproteobacteria bacterium]